MVAAAISVASGTKPAILMAAITPASLFTLMVPVGTPPNAIVYGPGYDTMQRMAGGPPSCHLTLP